MKRSLSTALLAASLGFGATGPALADGSISLHLAPGNDRTSRALATGLVLYSVAQEHRNTGRISQRGRNNLASLVQTGRGNYGVVTQEGRDHEAALRQEGHGNAYGIFQFGRGASADIRQYGSGQSGVTVQYGW